MNNSIINPVYAIFNTSSTANFVTFCVCVEQQDFLRSASSESSILRFGRPVILHL